MKWFAYCASAVLSSIAGILYICEVSVAEPQTLGRGYELNSIAAAVVGGCSLQGGVGTVPGTVLGALFLRIVIDGVAKIIKTGADVYEGLIVGVVVVFAVAFSQTGERRRTPFLTGGLGLVAAVNLSLMAGAMALLVGPTLLEGKTSLEGTYLGLWTATSVFAALALLRSGLRGIFRLLTAGLLAIGAVVFFLGLSYGVPAYRLHAATSIVTSLGGKLTVDPQGGTTVDLSGTDLDDSSLKQLVERLRSVPNVTQLSIARTRVTDHGLPAIRPLISLKRLDLSETKLSRGAKTTLGRSLPDVDIVE
jgi:hypothetical protein